MLTEAYRSAALEAYNRPDEYRPNSTIFWFPPFRLSIAYSCLSAPPKNATLD